MTWRSFGMLIILALLFALTMRNPDEQSACTAISPAFEPSALAAEPVPEKTPEAHYRVTFVELGSVNCVPCKMMQPVMAEIEKEYAGKVKVVFYDVWTAAGEPYGKKYNIRAIPTQIFLDKNGKEFFRHMGFFPKEEIVKVLQKQGVTKE